MKKCISIVIAVLMCVVPGSLIAQLYNVMDFGAKADGETINTKAIQAAIDKCALKGGKVIIPAGVFISGTLYLKSRVEIFVDKGGVLKGSSSFKDYPDNQVKYKNAFTHHDDGVNYTNKAFLFAEHVSDLAFSGTGTIDGSGDSPEFNLGNDDTPESRKRPCMLLIIDSKRIKVSGLFLTNSAYWLQNYLGCDDLKIRGVKIFNQSNYNQDGIDIDAKNVSIEDCVIDTDDDGICFKSHDRKRIVENVVVKNCVIGSNCNAIKFGTASIGGLKNVSISGCIIKKASADHIRHWQQNLKFIEQPVTVISGIALETVDGGVIENVRIRDIEMTDVQTPVFIVLGNRSRRQVGDTTYVAGKIANIEFYNIKATSHSKMCSSVTAWPGQYVENIHFNNILFNSMGNGTQEESELLFPENTTGYPENRMYGQVYPASGFFARHVKGLTIENAVVKIRNPDMRPSVMFDDVLNSQLNNAMLDTPSGGTAAIRLTRCTGIKIKDPVLSSISNPLLQLRETKSSEVIIGNFKKYDGWLQMDPVLK